MRIKRRNSHNSFDISLNSINEDLQVIFLPTPAPLVPEPVEPVEPVPVKKVKKEKTKMFNVRDAEYVKFANDKYKEFLQDFLDKKCVYEYGHMERLDNIHIAYRNFITENAAKIVKSNVNYTIHMNDIPILNNNYFLKKITVCRMCLKRKMLNCCDNYEQELSKDMRLQKSFIINMKLL